MCNIGFPWGHKESDTTERFSLTHLLVCVCVCVYIYIKLWINILYCYLSRKGFCFMCNFFSNIWDHTLFIVWYLAFAVFANSFCCCCLVGIFPTRLIFLFLISLYSTGSPRQKKCFSVELNGLPLKI